MIQQTVEVNGKEFVVQGERFYSVESIVSTCKERTKDPDTKNGDWKSFSKWFNGCGSYEEAEELAVTGYKEPVGRMIEAIGKVRTDSKKRFKQYSSPVGYAPIVPNALRGLPNSMVDARIVKLPMKVVRIKYDIAYSCGVSVEQAERAGTALLKAIIKLESEGYRVSIDCISGAKSETTSNSISYVSTRIKTAEQPLDIAKVSFPLIHPAFFRGILFTWMRASKECPRLGSCLGTPIEVALTTSGARELIRKVEHDKNAVVLGVQKLINCESKKEDIAEIIKEMMVS